MTARRLLSVAVAVLALVPFVFPQITPELRQTTNKLAGSIFTGPYMSTLEELTDTIGPRVTGSPGYDRAADWAADKFRAAGLTNVHFETFTIPNGWQRGPAQAQLIAPIQRVLHIAPVGWSPATAGDITAPIALLSELSPDALQHNPQIRDHILLLDVEHLQPKDADYTPALMKALPLLQQFGARGLLFPNAVSNNVLGDALDIGAGYAKVLPLPCAEIGMEDNGLLRRLLARGEVRLTFRLENRVTGPAEIRNVIAELKGREKPEEWIIVGAHLDSWDLGTGAQDNGSGTAMVLEAARAIQALGQPPRRTIRFALWGGEEPGLMGSTAYVAAHRGTDLAHCVMVVNTDDGAGHPWGWKLHGRTDVRDAMLPISESLLRDYSAAGLSTDFSYDTDHGPFLLEGIPALDLLPAEAQYNALHHKPSDTFDKVDAVDAKADTAIVGMVTYIMAELPNPLARRMNHKEVDEMLKRSGMYGYLTALGIWKP